MKLIPAAVLFLVLFLPLVFADVGPSPPKPDILVTFTKGGIPYSGDAMLVFRCLDNASSGGGPTGEREVTFSCKNGSCTNDRWFYKFNPCYYPDRGVFLYATGGDALVQSSEVSFKEGSWNVVIDAGTGKASQSSGGRLQLPCGLSFLAAIAPAALMLRMGRWN